MNKIDELELYIVEEKPDLICITESWTNETIGDAEINFSGYTLFRKDRKNRVGGGVLLYVRNNIKAVHRTDLENEVCEVVWCELQDGKERTLIGVCYSPSCNVNEDNELFKMLGNVRDRNTIVVGDFNFGEIDWMSQVATGQSQMFLDCVNDNFLHQHVELETRDQNILDLVLSTEENMVQDLEVGEPFGNSDHCIIRWKLAINKEIDVEKKMHNYFKADYDKIREEAKGIDWMDLIEEDSINKDWENVKATLDKLKTDYIPIRRQSRNKCKWANRKTTKCRRAKEKAWKKYRMLKDDVTYDKYKKKLSAANKSNKEAQKDFEKRLAENIKKQ